MKFLPTADLDGLSGALNFDTSDCNVTGACELYSTKSSGSDKKLLRQIDQELSDRQDELSRSLPRRLGGGAGGAFDVDRDAVVGAAPASSPGASVLMTDSAFGPLRDVTNRRTFAFLIATLNASHPHYEFSNCLRPVDFCKLDAVDEVAADVDANLHRFRHGALGRDHYNSDGTTAGAMGDAEGASFEVWGPACWSAINREIDLAACDIFRWCPEADPFKDDEGAVWSAHYLFFNREHKRVVYLNARMVPVLSSQSPPSQPVGSLKRSLSAFVSDGFRHGGGSAGGGGGGGGGSGSGSGNDHEGPQKRARFWLGDTDPSLIEFAEHDDEDDGFCWNRGEDGQMVTTAAAEQGGDDGEEDEEEEQYSDDGAAADDDDDEYDDEGGEVGKRGGALYRTRHHASFRGGVAEDSASRMEI